MFNEKPSANGGHNDFNSIPTDEKAVFNISLFKNKKDNQPQLERRSWQQLCDKFQKPSIRADKDGSLFSPAFFEPALRRKENVKELSLLVLDIDHNAELETLKTQLTALNSAYAIYSSHSHLRLTESNPNVEPRYRIVIPLFVPIASANYPALWQYVKHKTGLPLDEAAKDASRIFYTPAIAHKDAPFYSYISDGAFLDWRKLSLDEFKTQKQNDAGNQQTSHNWEKAKPISDAIPKGARRKTLLSVAGSMRRRGLTANEIFACLKSASLDNYGYFLHTARNKLVLSVSSWLRFHQA